MSWYDGPGDTLARNLLLVVDDYRASRLQYWSHDPAESTLIRMYDLVAEALLAATSDLLFTDTDTDEDWKQVDSAWARMVRIAEQSGFAQQLSESIEVLLAEDTIARLPESTRRSIQLAELIISDPPGEAVRRFLARLGRCYMAGFLPECVILCRATLENAVKERVDSEMRSRNASKPPIGMRARLSAAERFGLLTAERRRDAETVWLRGNIAVHDDPEATPDAFGTIVMTMGVLKELYMS